MLFLRCGVSADRGDRMTERLSARARRERAELVAYVRKMLEGLGPRTRTADHQKGERHGSPVKMVQFLERRRGEPRPVPEVDP